MSDVSDYLARVRQDLDTYTRLKKETPGSAQGWKRDGYTLMAESRPSTTKGATVGKTATTEITYFGVHGMQGPAESAALDFCVAAHNLKLEDHLATLLRMAEQAPEAKAKACLPGAIATK